MTNALYGAVLAATTAAPPPAAPSPVAAAVWVWPVQPPVVTRAFQPPPTPYAAGHRGIDLAGVSGQAVGAAGAGVVSFAGQVAGTGVVVVRHGVLRTTYEPIDPVVSVGQRVAAGDVLGHLAGGHIGCTVCLHFGLKRGEEYLDPLSLYARGPVRLVPVDGPVSAHLPGVPIVDAAASARDASSRAPALSVGPPLRAAPDTSSTGVAALGVSAVGATATVTSLAAIRERRRKRLA